MQAVGQIGAASRNRSYQEPTAVPLLRVQGTISGKRNREQIPGKRLRGMPQEDGCCLGYPVNLPNRDRLVAARWIKLFVSALRRNSGSLGLLADEIGS